LIGAAIKPDFAGNFNFLRPGLLSTASGQYIAWLPILQSALPEETADNSVEATAE